jgi:aspartyl-tRNA(Asn)/glutamyl-tRNA(Gln) amidotransferase subunit A
MSVSRREFLAGSVGVLGVSNLVPRDAGNVALKAQTASPAGELHYLTIREASNRISRKQLSPVELTQAILARIDQVEPKIHAFITLTREQALESARTAEADIMAGRYRGPLHGIPVAVKDTHYTKGIRSTGASPVLADFIPSFDATIVTKLKSAGAIIMGKTNLPEFSSGSSGNGTNNPWMLSRPTGGSSAGNAAGLGAGMFFGASGGDTGASIRGPAALCGVVGLKPTYGRVSGYGVMKLSWSVDHNGPMTRTVEDNALLLNVIAGPDPEDWASSDVPVPDYTRSLGRGVRGMRLGIPKREMIEGYFPDELKAFDDALIVFQKLGARIVEVDLPDTLAVMGDAHNIIRICEAASYHEPFLATKAELYGPTAVRRDVEAGALITAGQYLRAQKMRKIFVKQMLEIFSGFDLMITPETVPAGERSSGRFSPHSPFNDTGFPGMAVPAGFSTSPAGLPLSIQIVGKPFDEETVYAAGHAYESATPWHERRPTLMEGNAGPAQ